MCQKRRPTGLLGLLIFSLFSCGPPEDGVDDTPSAGPDSSSTGTEVPTPAFSDLSGPYLGQAPALSEPSPFAPGLVSTGLSERDVAMMPDGSELYWGVVGGRYAWTTVLVSRRVDGVWTEPEVAPCCTDPDYLNLEPHITPDGNQFLWLSTRPGPGPNNGGQEIWAMDREGDGWGEPYPLPEVINSPDAEFFPSVTRDGTLYFTRGPVGGGENRILRSRKVNGAYQEPELLPEQVNAGADRFNAFVDPDEEFLILGMAGMPDSFGGTDYYVVFRNARDQWSEPVNLGSAVNTEGNFEYSAYVSPDGEFLFFMGSRLDVDRLAPGGRFDVSALRAAPSEIENGNWDIYWMRSDLLEELKPEGF